MSLTNSKNKLEINTIYYLNRGKIYIAAACADGSVIFFLKPNHQTNKDYQTDDLVKSIVKKNVHRGAINIIRANSEFLAMGGQDNTISFWKIVGCSLNSKIELPGQDSNQIENLEQVRKEILFEKA